MRWLYHKTLEPRLFEDAEVENALTSGWAITPKDALTQEIIKPAKVVPEKAPAKFLSQMTVKELLKEGEKCGLAFAGETKRQMRAAINKARE